MVLKRVNPGEIFCNALCALLIVHFINNFTYRLIVFGIWTLFLRTTLLKVSFVKVGYRERLDEYFFVIYICSFARKVFHYGNYPLTKSFCF